jgi:hypothetical protein
MCIDAVGSKLERVEWQFIKKVSACYVRMRSIKVLLYWIILIFRYLSYWSILNLSLHSIILLRFFRKLRGWIEN